MTYWNNINENGNGNENENENGNENENENGNENGNEDGEDGEGSGFATIFFKTINIYKHFKHLRL